MFTDLFALFTIMLLFRVSVRRVNAWVDYQHSNRCPAQLISLAARALLTMWRDHHCMADILPWRIFLRTKATQGVAVIGHQPSCHLGTRL